jgi:hypothetical protein
MSSVEEPLPLGTRADAAVAPASPIFFPVSLTKLLLLSICTLSLYEVYWFYKNWQLVKRRDASDIIPALRAVFSVFFCYALFQRVQEEAEKSHASALAAGALAAGWIIFTLLWHLPDPYWLVSFLAVFFMLPVQHAANAVNNHVAPDHDRNKRFTAWNIATVVIGGLLFTLAVIGTFLPGEQA